MIMTLVEKAKHVSRGIQDTVLRTCPQGYPGGQCQLQIKKERTKPVSRDFQESVIRTCPLGFPGGQCAGRVHRDPIYTLSDSETGWCQSLMSFPDVTRSAAALTLAV